VVRINGTSFTIVGVAPEGFRGIVRGVTPIDIWIPTAMFKAGIDIAMACRGDATSST
jgi:hypothetical protein